jgi:hypothetical protein
MQWIVQMMGRAEIREKYNIDGNGEIFPSSLKPKSTLLTFLGCTDCLCACCCGPCDLVQQEKEIVNRETASLIAVQPNKMEQENQMAYPQHQQQQQHQQPPQYPQQHQYTQ